MIALAGEGLLDVPAAAGRAEVSERQMRRWCESGKVVCHLDNGAYWIEPASLAQLISSRSRKKSRRKDTVSGDGRDSEPESELPPSSEPGPNLKSDMDLSDGQDAEPDGRKAERTRHKGVPKMSVEEPADSAVDGHEDMDSLKRRLHFEQARNELIQARLSEILRQLRASPDDLRKSSSRRRRDRRLNRVLVLSLLNLLALLTVLLSIYGK